MRALLHNIHEVEFRLDTCATDASVSDKVGERLIKSWWEVLPISGLGDVKFIGVEHATAYPAPPLTAIVPHIENPDWRGPHPVLSQ